MKSADDDIQKEYKVGSQVFVDGEWKGQIIDILIDNKTGLQWHVVENDTGQRFLLDALMTGDNELEVIS